MPELQIRYIGLNNGEKLFIQNNCLNCLIYPQIHRLHNNWFMFQISLLTTLFMRS